MTAPTTCKEAIKKWEDQTKKSSSNEEEVILSFQWPPIERMDNSLSTLRNVTKLSLSSNMIEKIAGLDSLKNLKILSLGRNYIKSFAGLETVGAHLEQLWISYNHIEKIKGVSIFKSLRVLYMGNNLVKDWAEVNRLQEILNLEELILVNNPICENLDVESWRIQIIKRLPKLTKLDGIPIVHLEN